MKTLTAKKSNGSVFIECEGEAVAVVVGGGRRSGDEWAADIIAAYNDLADARAGWEAAVEELREADALRDRLIAQLKETLILAGAA